MHDIPSSFEKTGTILHKGRNESRLVQVGGEKFVIKYFKRITLFNRFIYVFFRRSKAQRAYENALVLSELGISTPQPVGFINCYRGLLLGKSYFISLYVEHNSLEDTISKPETVNRDVLGNFARFTFSLHQKGVFHNDFHLNNVLYEKTLNDHKFYLIDNNRMRFRRPTRYRNARNLKRINLPFEKYTVFVGEYARQYQSDPYEFFGSILFYRKLHGFFSRVKRYIKKTV